MNCCKWHIINWVLKLDIMNRFIQKSRKKEITELIRYQKYAITYYEKGEYDKSLNYYKNALSISEKVLGLAHPSTATTYNNIALVYKDQGEYVKALEYSQKDLAITEKVLGADHPSTATTYNNLAVIYRNLGDYTKGLEYFKKALEIQENSRTYAPRYSNDV